MIDLRPYLDTFQPKPLAILGLGKSGFAAMRACIAAGVPPIAWDDCEITRDQAQKAGAQIINLNNLNTNDYLGFGALLLSPGIPLYYPAPHPVVKKAQEAGIEVLGDIEILYRAQPRLKSIGITGTNGKSTTTALIAHIFKTLNASHIMGGNIGEPVLGLSSQTGDETFILEISSYQMDLCPTYRPSISIVLNITPDHLDRHGTMERYAQAKARIMDGLGFGICGIDDEWTCQIYEECLQKNERVMTPISIERPVPGGVYVQNNELIDSMDKDEGLEIGALDDLPSLKGSHNHQNVCAAYAACRRAGFGSDAIFQAMKTYPGLAHRQFLVRTINGVSYINDSKATNAQATAKALASYKDIYLIAGGRPKDGGLNGIEPWLSNIRHVYLIGEAAGEFDVWCQQHGAPSMQCETLDYALMNAHNDAQANRGKPGEGSVVLLSPACASWDQFDNFEHRGNVFTSLVQALPEKG